MKASGEAAALDDIPTCRHAADGVVTASWSAAEMMALCGFDVATTLVSKRTAPDLGGVGRVGGARVVHDALQFLRAREPPVAVAEVLRTGGLEDAEWPRVGRITRAQYDAEDRRIRDDALYRPRNRMHS
jgi:hypothetical protein